MKPKFPLFRFLSKFHVSVDLYRSGRPRDQANETSFGGNILDKLFDYLCAIDWMCPVIGGYRRHTWNTLSVLPLGNNFQVIFIPPPPPSFSMHIPSSFKSRKILVATQWTQTWFAFRAIYYLFLFCFFSISILCVVSLLLLLFLIVFFSIFFFQSLSLGFFSSSFTDKRTPQTFWHVAKLGILTHHFLPEED